MWIAGFTARKMNLCPEIWKVGLAINHQKWLSNPTKLTRQTKQKVAHMTRQIITKSTQIHRKSMKIDAWTGPGDSWEGLGSQFGSQGLPGTAKKGQMAKMCPKMGSHLGVHFQQFPIIFWYMFALCFRDSILVATGTVFWWILVGFWICFCSFFC